MPQILVRDLSAKTVRQLKARARSGGRSVMKAPAAEEKKTTPDLPEDTTLPEKGQPASSPTVPETPFP